jgi:hypothetical protein
MNHTPVYCAGPPRSVLLFLALAVTFFALPPALGVPKAKEVADHGPQQTTTHEQIIILGVVPVPQPLAIDVVHTPVPSLAIGVIIFPQGMVRTTNEAIEPSSVYQPAGRMHMATEIIIAPASQVVLDLVTAPAQVALTIWRDSVDKEVEWRSSAPIVGNVSGCLCRSVLLCVCV